MAERDYYPAGAYNDPNAPYNEQAEPDPIEVECDTAVTLRKFIVVETDNYTLDFDEESGNYDIDLNDDCIDLANKVEEQHYSLTDLLNELVKYIKNDLCADIPEKRKRELREMLADAEGWEECCVEVDEYKT